MKLFNRLRNFRNSQKFAFLVGLSATIWFLLRVIPKPSRANYPCMKAAAPLMSSFVIYLLGISTSVFSFKKFRQYARSSRFLIAGVFLIMMLVSFSFILLKDAPPALSRSISGVDDFFPVVSNTPVGEAKGLFPGRVVWVHDANATNEDYDPATAESHLWYSNENADPEVIENMLNMAIKKYAGVEESSEAWDLIFKAFNESHGRGNQGYQAGEKIAIKINLTNQSCPSDQRKERMDAAPQLINALLHELILYAGVAPGDITLGDPYRDFRGEYINLVRSVYPDVNYVDGNGGTGVSQTVPSSDEVLVFSDKQHKSTLPQHYLDATYLINMPCLKSHNEGGITLIAKNHQGSYLAKGENPASQYAIAMHYSLPANDRGQQKYRHTVDYMGHEQTGGKGLIYIVDGIWGGQSWEGWILKYKMDPFLNDYPSSIFVGQDPVAVESVCYDVIFREYVVDVTKANYPIDYKAEIADYLLQCASSDYWPDGIVYDPEGDGTPIGSLGVFEHWNNPTDRQYTRNLGTGNGVEMNYYNLALLNKPEYQARVKVDVAPNPMSDYTVFSTSENLDKDARLRIYNISGQLMTELLFNGSDHIIWNGTGSRGTALANGIYVYNIYNGLNGDVYSGRISLNR